MVIKKGAILSTKFNDYIWPSEWKTNDWQTITNDGKEYKAITFLSELMTVFAESKFDFCSDASTFDVWMQAEYLKQAQAKGFAAWNALVARVSSTANYNDLAAFADTFSPVRKAINLGRLQDAKILAQALEVSDILTQQNKDYFIGLL